MNTIILEAGPTGDNGAFMIMMALIFVVMYFFMIRPQKRKQDADQKFRDALKKGDKVITIGGIHGRITELSNHTVVIERNGVKLTVERSAISTNAIAADLE